MCTSAANRIHTSRHKCAQCESSYWFAVHCTFEYNDRRLRLNSDSDHWLAPGSDLAARRGAARRRPAVRRALSGAQRVFGVLMISRGFRMAAQVRCELAIGELSSSALALEYKVLSAGGRSYRGLTCCEHPTLTSRARRVLRKLTGEHNMLRVLATFSQSQLQRQDKSFLEKSSDSPLITAFAH